MDYSYKYRKYKKKYLDLKQIGGGLFGPTESQRPKIVITLPHSKCLPGETREEKLCDIRSAEIGESLYKDLKETFPIRIIYSENNRL